MNYKCSTCNTQVLKDYCRSCDEFLFVCACANEDVEKHKDHRKYLTGFKCTKCKCVGGCTCCTPDRCMCAENGVELDDTTTEGKSC